MQMTDYIVIPVLVIGMIYFTGFLFGLGYFTASKFFHHKTILGGSLNIDSDKTEESAWH